MAILPKNSSASVTLSGYAQKFIDKSTPAFEACKTMTVNTISTAKGVLDRYPPVQALTYSFAAFSLIPILCFAAVGLASGAAVLSVAGSGAAIVQGSILAFSGFWLFLAIWGALIGGGIVAFWFSVGFFGLQTAKKLAK